MNPNCSIAEFCLTTAGTAFVDSTVASVETVKSTSSNTKPYSLFLLIIPFITVSGNGLVIAAVVRERSLQTVTNFLIVSLAVSDLLVACVMSFAVYFEWNDFVWDLGPGLCKLYIGVDVACSTASILNLLAICIDRYIAIGHPLAYAQYGTRSSRAFLSIGVVWVVSISVALPVFLGANQVDSSKQQCEFTNAYFIIFSSLLSFFLPCAAMILLYTVIFYRLRARERARCLRHMTTPTQGRPDSDHISTALLSGAKVAHQVGKHFKRRADQLFYEYSYATSSYPTVSNSSEDLSLCPQQLTEPIRSSNSQLTPVGALNCPTRMTLGPSTSSSETPAATPPFRSFGDDLAESFPFIDSLSQTSLDFADTPTANPNRKPNSNRVVNEESGLLAFESSQEENSNHRCNLQLPSVYSSNNDHDAFSLPATSLIRSEGLQRRQPASKVLNSTRVQGKSQNNGPLFFAILGTWWRSNAVENGGSVKNTIEDSKAGSRRTSLTSDNKPVGLLRRLFCGFRLNKRPSRHLVKKATRQLKREQKATITLAVVLAVFLVCWVPFFSFHLSNALCMIAYESNCVHFFMTFLTTWLGYCNSCFNPLVYSVFDHRFRRAFRNILHR